ncbi:hypothetical protein MPTK1_2g06340 [Marchantia polymorpha subsp. ruderalis]|nr:hypothetical protein MARPO_0021s0089 [Marchantia polymorpha]BBN01306.1 hypothetical protein Mp_2g06340 [Marchantia polymorpha subsp. ruderalis]|eukprot:PTQ44231.1 hypothetical protein MARPO_0021s0089 [Marchantia polymorpha]
MWREERCEFCLAFFFSLFDISSPSLARARRAWAREREREARLGPAGQPRRALSLGPASRAVKRREGFNCEATGTVDAMDRGHDQSAAERTQQPSSSLSLHSTARSLALPQGLIMTGPAEPALGRSPVPCALYEAARP